MVRCNNNQGDWNTGGCFEKLIIVVSLLNTHLLHIFVNSDVTDTFAVELQFCYDYSVLDSIA